MRLLLCVVAMVMAGGLGTSAIVLRSADADANVKKATRFVGLAYNLLKADPDAAGGGGVDPGFLTTRRVVPEEPSNYETFLRHSCVSHNFTSTIYDEKSFQKKFDMDVKTEASVSAKLVTARFSLSTSFHKAKDKTEKSKMMTFESQTLCNLGTARLKTEMNSFKISEGFQAAVCQLPDDYDKDAYTRFIDDWGTNYVVEVDVGVRNLTEKAETFTSVFKNLQESFGLQSGVSASYGNPFVSASGSVEMDMNKLSNSKELREAFHGSETVKMIGTEAFPEPISVVLGNIDKLVTATFFGTQNPASCSSAVMSKLPTKQANLVRALQEYPEAKGVVLTPTDGKVRLPLNWPKGTYGLLQPQSGCPNGWATGTRGFDGDNGGQSLVGATAGNHFATTFTSGNIQLKFCMKTVPITDMNTDMDWPKGEYCIYKYRDCPQGFSVGSIYHDDEDMFNSNWKEGTLPDGDYDKNTRIYYCCRSDRANTVPIFLPNTQPFYLLQAKSYGCQQVAGMNVRTEEIQWDDEDLANKNSHSGVVPHNNPSTSSNYNWRLFFCYYYK